ncbi:MAG: hypothetical protein WCF93_02540 [Candidatus Moraniibacteriota bacterium]
MNINKNKLIEIAIIAGIGIMTVEVTVFLAAKNAPAPASTNQPIVPVAQMQSSATVSNNSSESSNQQNLQTASTDASSIKPAVEPGTCKDFEAIK